jgi:hypothetical protein
MALLRQQKEFKNSQISSPDQLRDSEPVSQTDDDRAPHRSYTKSTVNSQQSVAVHTTTATHSREHITALCSILTADRTCVTCCCCCCCCWCGMCSYLYLDIVYCLLLLRWAICDMTNGYGFQALAGRRKREALSSIIYHYYFESP